jgi:hypothetical protein
MPSLKHFLEAMEASWPVALTVFLGAAALLTCDHFGLSYTKVLPEWFLGAIFIFLVFSSAVLVVSLLRFVVNAIARPIRRKRAEKWRQEHAEKMKDLPIPEIGVLLWAASQNTQVFLAPFNHELLEPLVAKGYVEHVPGHHSILDWPHHIPDHVWTFLRAELRAEPQLDRIENPFRRYRY